VTQSNSTGFTPRRWIALTALVSGMVAFYLHLTKLGLAGELACNAAHTCDTVQRSPWGQFLGVDVALIGVIGYALIFVTAMVGVQAKWIGDRRITQLLMLLIIPGFLFTLRLKYGEFIDLKTFCPWCAISAVTITTQLIAVFVDRRRVIANK
jgi:uncharacterized membrane protein